MDRSFFIRDVRLAYVVSLVIAAVMTVASIAGLLFGTTGLYGDQTNLFPAFLGQDALNLLVGLPLLLAGMWLARRGSLIGVLLWPGALFYVIYDYGFYALGAPVNAFFVAYLLLVTASAYTTIGIVTSIDARGVRDRLGTVVPARTIGTFLIALAAIFTLLWSAMIASTVTSGAPADQIGRIVWTLDLTVQLPALFVGGLLLWRRHELGYVVTFGLLLQAAAYLLGLSAICIIGRSPTGAAVTIADWVPGIVVGGIALALMGFYVRGAAQSRVARAGPAGRIASHATAP